MKLRLRGNSLRLRLGQAEVTALAETGTVEETTSFGAASFVYAIVCDDSATTLSANVLGARIEVRLPTRLAREWAASEAVGLDHTQGELRILVEKDFACLKPRTGEDDGDAFPNPNTTC